MIPWYNQHPDSISIEEATEILEDKDSRHHFPQIYNDLLLSVQERIQKLKEDSQRQNPLAWIQPSYEQTLKLNCWIYGIDYLVDFDANRIGKTAASIINALLWLIPNQQEWVMFQPHTDKYNRTFQVIPRPSIYTLQKIRETLKLHDLKGNPQLFLEDPNNLTCYNAILPLLQTPQKPNPKKRTIWQGAPDNDYQKEIIMVEWKKWLPPNLIERYSEYDLEIKLAFPPNNETTILFKSYDSKDTKWSGAAVDGILLTEGVPQDVFNEVRQRYKYPAFASWDYTPYEARNTATKSALAHRVFSGKELLPLHPHIFSGLGIEKTPDYILPEEKKQDMIKMWHGKPQAAARIHGNFYSSSPVVLKNYDPKLHTLPISFADLRKIYEPRSLILFRGLDPGWGHVTSCTWMALAPDNTRFIYRIYSEAQRSIEERCTDIITLSGNQRVKHPKSDIMWSEKVANPNNSIRITWLDYHSFKTDENTGRSFSLNYIRNGLLVRPSLTLGPKERGTAFNDLLQPQLHLPHPITKKPPGSKIYFLINEPGVAEGLQKMENVFWQTFEKGEKRGLTKDAIQDTDDDELDSTCYVSLPQLYYQSFLSSVDQENQEEKILFNSLTTTKLLV